MYNFEYYTPTKVIFGKNTESRTGELVKKQQCRMALILYGGRSAVRSGLITRITESLDHEGIAHVELGGVVPNPRLSLVYQGIELCRREGVDFILAVGGGSVIDSAKTIGSGVKYDGDVWDFFEGRQIPEACLPIGVVLTIAAAGSEMSNGCVITKEEGWLKRSFDNDLIRPRFAIMDPELTKTLPDYQTACGCSDILMHTMERYFVSGDTMEITDSLAEALMRTVIANARILKRHPDDYDARAEIMWAGSLSHNGLTACGNSGNDFATHMLEHEVGGMFDVAHGAGLTALWGSWARYVYQDCLPRFTQFARNVMGVEDEKTPEETALKGIAALEDFFRSIGMPVSLRELNIDPTEEQMKTMAKLCRQATGDHAGSAKVLHEADMLKIYEMARGI